MTHFKDRAQRKSGLRSGPFLGVAFIGGVLQTGLASAQSPSQPPTTSSSAAIVPPSAIPEIVVTAERRSGTVQSAPLSITAYSGDLLKRQGITNISQLGYETPGVSERNAGPGQTEYEIRGVSSAGGSSPTVGFYLDDVPLTAPAEGLEGKVVIDPSLYDLNRVEVLRGPQGTLFGSGSMGGTIRLITNAPNAHDYGASGDLTGSGTQGGAANYALNLMVNAPIIEDKLALRVVGTESYTSGWIDRIVLNPFPVETDGGFTRGDVSDVAPSQVRKNVNWDRLGGVRASLLWTPLSNLSVTPTVFYQRVTQGGLNYVDEPPGVNAEAHYQPFNIAEPYADTFELYTLPAQYRLDGIQIDSITAFYNRVSSLKQDSSEVGQDFLEALIGVPNVSYTNAGAVTAFEFDKSSQFSQEVRLSSTGHNPFQWVAGAFYSRFQSQTQIGTTTPGPLVNEIFGAPSFFTLAFKNVISQYAGFGEASYEYAKFKLTAGLRYYSYTNEETLSEGGGLITGSGPPLLYSLPATSSGFNPKLNVSYEPTPNFTGYVQAAKGFRPGGANAPPPSSCPSNPLQFGPDSLWSYEAGVKARFFDHRLTVHAAVYYEDWPKIQQLVSEQCGATYTANAGTAHIYGGEVEVAAQLLRDLTITTAAGYTHANLVSTTPDTGFDPGDRVQDVPQWTDTTTFTYRHPVTGAYDFVLHAENVYAGTERDTGFTLRRLPARNIASIRASLIGSSGVSLSLFIDNLTDKRAYIGDPEEIFSFVPALNRVTTNQPRTVGLEFSYALGAR